MHRIVLFEDDGFVRLLPLVYWRSVFELRHGRKILIDRTAQRLGAPVAGVWTRGWIAKVASQRCGVPANAPIDASTVLVNGRWMMDAPFTVPAAPSIGVCEGEVAYIVCDDVLAHRLTPDDLLDSGRREGILANIPRHPVGGVHIRYPWDFITGLPGTLQEEWSAHDASVEVELDPRCAVNNGGGLHVGPNTTVHPTAVLDATDGPVYISHDVRIGAHAVVSGPCYIGPGTVLHPHAWLHGANAIGPMCKIGGEVDGCVIMAFTNKQHNGFLGHAYVASWVNIGAGTNNSDLKNTYGSVRVPINGVDVDTKETFVGAIIADHAKMGINTTLPTGAVVGLAAMIAASAIPPKFVRSFGWFADGGLRSGDCAKLLDVATAVMARRRVDMTDDEVELFLELELLVRSFERG